MIILSRSQLFRNDGTGLNVTRKSGTGIGLALAPTWDMVLAKRAGYMTQPAYIEAYHKILDELPAAVWAALPDFAVARASRTGVTTRHLTFLCYCRDGSFCHTYLLMDYMIGRFPAQYCYWR